MSKQGSKKETIFTLYQKRYPKCIEDIIGVKMERIKTEVNKGAKKIDLQAINSKKRIEIYVENQLKPSDRRDHLERKIIPLLQNIAEGYVVWTATKFHQEHIDEVKQYLRENQQKYINFYAVEIQPAVLERIHLLNSMYELEVWNNLKIINDVELKLVLVDKQEQMPPNHIGKAYTSDYVYDFSREDDIKEYMIEQFRESIPYYLNFHNSKKHSRYDKILKVGGGISDVTYFASAMDVRYRAFVEIRFGISQSDLYEHLKKEESFIKRDVNFNIRFEDKKRAIGVHLKSNQNDIPSTVNQLTYLFERFINYFSPYTFTKGNRTNVE